jgi:hypothetical protein
MSTTPKSVDTYNLDLSKLRPKSTLIKIRANANIREKPSMEGKILKVATPKDVIHVRRVEPREGSGIIYSGDWMNVSYIVKVVEDPVTMGSSITWGKGWLHKGVVPFDQSKTNSTTEEIVTDKPKVVKPTDIVGDKTDTGTGGSSPFFSGLELFDGFGSLKWIVIGVLGLMTYKVLK